MTKLNRANFDITHTVSLCTIQTAITLATVNKYMEGEKIVLEWICVALTIPNHREICTCSFSLSDTLIHANVGTQTSAPAALIFTHTHTPKLKSIHGQKIKL